MQQFTNFVGEIRRWVILAISVYLIYEVVIPALGVILYVEEVTNDTLQATGDYVNSWYDWWYDEPVTDSDN